MNLNNQSESFNVSLLSPPFLIDQSEGNYVLGTIFQVIMPLIIGFGLLGNLMAILLLSGRATTKLPRYPSHVFLKTLASVDIAFLTNLLIQYLGSAAGLKWPPQTMFVCKLTIYTTHLSDFVAVWLTVAIAAERFVVLAYPRYCHQICTITNAKWCTLGVLIVSSVLCAWTLVVAEGIDEGCTVNMNSTTVKWTYDVGNTMDIFLSCFVPTIVIVTLNVVVTKQLRQYFRKSVKLGLTMALECAYSPNTTILPMRNRKLLIRKTEEQLTKCLIIVTSVFVLMNLPYYVIRFYAELTNHHLENWFLSFSTVLYYAHHAISFYLYTFFGPGMKSTFWRLAKRLMVGCISCECMDMCGCCGNQFETY